MPKDSDRFEIELQLLSNKYIKNLPAYVVSEYIMNCLKALDGVVNFMQKGGDGE